MLTHAGALFCLHFVFLSMVAVLSISEAVLTSFGSCCLTTILYDGFAI
jgi:hypothetical protein